MADHARGVYPDPQAPAGSLALPLPATDVRKWMDERCYDSNEGLQGAGFGLTNLDWNRLAGRTWQPNARTGYTRLGSLDFLAQLLEDL